jgi:hypothetical protein
MNPAENASPDLKALATELIGSELVSTRFLSFLIGFLGEAYGIERCELVPDLECFTNAQANTYAYQSKSEINNICGAIQLSPVRTGKVARSTKTITKVPDCLNVGFDKSKILYDSGAYTDVLTNSRVTQESSLNRQLETLAQLPPAREIWLVTYDRLIDEKHIIVGHTVKQRWSVEEGEEAVRQTVEAARYLDEFRHRLNGYKLVMSCQGVNADQYARCVEQVLEYVKPDDVLGLGGWCILGKQKRWQGTFWETIQRVIPMVAESGVKRVHIFGCTWYKPIKGFPNPPLPVLLNLCDRYRISLSTDGRSPISNALWKNGWKAAGAKFSYWRHNLAWVKAEMAVLRDSPEYGRAEAVLSVPKPISVSIEEKTAPRHRFDFYESPHWFLTDEEILEIIRKAESLRFDVGEIIPIIISPTSKDAQNLPSDANLLHRSRGQRGSGTKPASGSLSFVPCRKKKDGSDGADRALYSYSVKEGGKWKTLKLHVPVGRVQVVKEAIAQHKGVQYILEKILRK